MKQFCLIGRYGLEFTLCSFAGWLYEVLLNAIIYQNYADRGILHLPLCPIYGFAGLAIVLLFRKQNRWHTVFLGSVILPTVLELLAYHPIRQLTGLVLWDYRAWPCNYKGIISLPSSLLFGVLGLLLVKGMHPLMDWIQATAPKWLVTAGGLLCIGGILTDAVIVVVTRFL